MNGSGTQGRAAALVAAGVLLFVLGLGAGVFLTRGGETSVAEDAGGHAGADLYTCGMHPNVIHEGPGICPICNMDLTPLKKSTSGVAPEERAIKYWVAPMDPNFISDKPGKSPMGMDLVPVYEDEVESSRAIVIDPTVVQNIGVRTAKVRRGPLAKTIRATGEIVEDETRVGIVNLKVAGWIDKVYVDETGQHVREGDPLLEIYSPELVTTQEEYRIARSNLRRARAGRAPEVIAAAERTLAATRRRLLYWDITEAQIAELERTDETRKTMILRSPFTGVVTMKNALPGQKVVPGTDLYHIADLRVVWVEASVFDSDLPYVKLGQKARMTLSFLPGKVFEGRVAFLSPVLNPKTRDLKVRLEFPNDEGYLRPGMYADVVIRSELSDDAVLVPSEAIIRSGVRNVVFVARGEGRFIPTEIEIGAHGEGNELHVLAGVVPGEEVVTSAQFLLDSESSFQEAIRKMVSEKSGGSGREAPPEREEEAGGMGGGKDADAGGQEEKEAKRETSGAADRFEPLVDARFEGVPVANAVAIEPDGGITIMCPVLKGRRTVEAGDVYTEYQGMRVYYCCPMCQSKFEADPEKYLAELGEMLRGRG